MAQEKLVVNLVPMIDIMFQLIVFFTLLINFDQANKDERVRLPVADLAKPAEMQIDELLILNLNRRGLVNVGLGGETFLDPDSDAFRLFIAREAKLAERNMKRYGKEVKRDPSGRPQLWTTVMIRADRHAEYGKVQRMIRICQEQGYYKFALRATAEEAQ
jgi:biopolymer transport protein ExbD